MSATAGPASPIQTHLAFSLGSAIPLYVNPEAGDLAFLLSLPIIDTNNIYRLKDVVNVGFWQGNTYVKIHTPEVVAYHDNNEQLYLAPNLKMCTLTKDIHFLCPSKPFLRDNTEGICGLESIKPDTSCPTEATPRSQVESPLELVKHMGQVPLSLHTVTIYTNLSLTSAKCFTIQPEIPSSASNSHHLHQGLETSLWLQSSAYK
ncbi:hypothetical protein G5714_014644 [Onychostoma macrolepis]|uniref:Uncharacterized protein n=1 Tax=Onychostoma macrolepis TaxID=369639 RepID=A0A7J6CFB9_9TELE|nr:hypothetical protein G5714_014644 [Onychostoma macrolepis]